MEFNFSILIVKSKSRYCIKNSTLVFNSWLKTLTIQVLNALFSFRSEKDIKHCLIKQEGRLFVIGTAEYESLIELVAYYEKNPLYKKTRLYAPVTDDLLSNNGTESASFNICSDPNDEYMDPNAFVQKISVMALFDYKASRNDEHTFNKGAIINNVVKQDGGWWKGDWDGKKQHWFPANYVRELEPVEMDDAGAGPHGTGDQIMPLGSMQKGAVSVLNAKVSIEENPDPVNNMECVLRIQATSGQTKKLEMASPSLDDLKTWMKKIKDTASEASLRDQEHRRREKSLKISRDLSNLVIYCSTVEFRLEKYTKKNERQHVHFEMSSFPETRAERLMFQSAENMQIFLWYHVVQISRVYPKANRVDSSNYNPMPMWNLGSQMAALNYQTGDKPMQLNAGKFLLNGNCGYVLKPEYMFRDGYLPKDPSGLTQLKQGPVGLSVRVIAARHLSRKGGRGLVSPFIEVEICGADFDSNVKKTKTIADNGFNPVWDESFEFKVICPELALFRLVAYDVDMFGEYNFIGQSTLPVTALRSGFRSLPLKNSFSEEIELASVLVRMTKKDAKLASAITAANKELAGLEATKSGFDMTRKLSQTAKLFDPSS